MKAKHSPGPWRAEAAPESSYGDWRVWLGREYINVYKEGDARLIAAAPATLAALEQVIADIVQMVGHRSCYGMPIASEEHPWHNVIAEARAAVAAAKGE